MEIGELVVLVLETLIVSFGMKIMSVLITVILYGRMIEIYLYTSIAPIPFATMTTANGDRSGPIISGAFCPGVPGIPDDGMRGNLFHTGGGHPVFG